MTSDRSSLHLDRLHDFKYLQLCHPIYSSIDRSTANLKAHIINLSIAKVLQLYYSTTSAVDG